jgi:hypothetical protein
MLKKHVPLLKEMARDRDILTAWIIFVLSAVLVIITAAVHVVPSELQVTVHYTGYGVTNFYYLAVFAAQAVVLLVAHTLIALKLHEYKGKGFTVFFLYLSVVLALMTELLLLALFRVVALA